METKVHIEMPGQKVVEETQEPKEVPKEEKKKGESEFKLEDFVFVDEDGKVYKRKPKKPTREYIVGGQTNDKKEFLIYPRYDNAEDSLIAWEEDREGSKEFQRSSRFNLHPYLFFNPQTRKVTKDVLENAMSEGRENIKLANEKEQQVIDLIKKATTLDELYFTLEDLDEAGADPRDSVVFTNPITDKVLTLTEIKESIRSYLTGSWMPDKEIPIQYGLFDKVNELVEKYQTVSSHGR